MLQLKVQVKLQGTCYVKLTRYGFYTVSSNSDAKLECSISLIINVQNTFLVFDEKQSPINKYDKHVLKVKKNEPWDAWPRKKIEMSEIEAKKTEVKVYISLNQLLVSNLVVTRYATMEKSNLLYRTLSRYVLKCMVKFSAAKTLEYPSFPYALSGIWRILPNTIPWDC